MSSRSTLFRFLCAALLTLVAAILLARVALLEIESRTANTNRFMRHRLREMMAALPQIAKIQKPVALVFGSSDMEIEFHPDVFDSEMKKRGKEIVSFNLAVRNSTAVFSTIVDRVRKEGIRPELSIVKFSPSYLTQKAKQLWNVSDDVRSELVSGKQLLANRYLFDGMSPSMARFYVSDWFNSFRRFKLSDGSPLLFRNRELNSGTAWNFERRGFFFFGWPEKQAELTRVLRDYQQPEVQQAVMQYHRNCCDSEGLHFDVELLRNFIGSVREVSRISKKTFLLYYPDNIGRTDAAKKRMLHTMEMIAEQTGAGLLNMENVFSREEYVDPVHLTFEGGVTLSKQMAIKLPR